MDSVIDKEDEDTPLPTLPSGSCGITVMEADTATLCSEGIAVDDNKDPAPDNVMHSDNVLSTPSSLTIDVEPQLYFWSQLIWEMIDNTLDLVIGGGGFMEYI